jgi:hypothetical protein
VDVYDKIVALEEGAIIHLRGAAPVYLQTLNAYGLDVEQVLKLKEYDEEIQERQQKQSRREALLRQQMEAEGLFNDSPLNA